MQRFGRNDSRKALCRAEVVEKCERLMDHQHKDNCENEELWEFRKHVMLCVVHTTRITEQRAVSRDAEIGFCRSLFLIVG